LKRLDFDLADPLPRQAENVGNLLQRVFALAADSISHPDHLLFIRRQHLEHTFGPGDGTCSKPGDKIKDTPTEAEPQFFCKARNSCDGANNPGDDPITNFMDYVDDVCMDNFTPDQTRRMHTHWHAYRDKKTRLDK